MKEAPGDGPPQTVDQALAHAESALVNGRLTDAALTLERGLAGIGINAHKPCICIPYGYLQQFHESLVRSILTIKMLYCSFQN